MFSGLLIQVVLFCLNPNKLIFTFVYWILTVIGQFEVRYLFLPSFSFLLPVIGVPVLRGCMRCFYGRRRCVFRSRGRSTRWGVAYFPFSILNFFLSSSLVLKLAPPPTLCLHPFRISILFLSFSTPPSRFYVTCWRGLLSLSLVGRWLAYSIIWSIRFYLKAIRFLMAA